jgi:hypothetical protein
LQKFFKELKMNSYQVAQIEKFKITRDAVTHAQNCLESRSGWDVETLSFSIECVYPEIESDKCERIAAAVMRKVGLL